MYNECLEMRKRLSGDRVDLNNLGLVKRDQGSLAEAETMFRNSLMMKRQLFGRDAVHIEIATTLDSLGRTLHDRGMLSEAEHMYSKCLEMIKKLYG